MAYKYPYVLHIYIQVKIQRYSYLLTLEYATTGVVKEKKKEKNPQRASTPDL